MLKIEELVRLNIRDLEPYSSARHEFSGEANIWLDANENPFETGLNRYPDPFQEKLKIMISEIKGISPDQLFIGNGSDEAIDLLFRAFCEPQIDKAYIFPPTYGMYKVSANINNVEIVELSLAENFELLQIDELKKHIGSKGLLFICSPNNPTGNSYPLNIIKEIADNFSGLVVVDEAYIDFSSSDSAICLLENTSNVVVLQTMSKAYGMAGLRLGLAIANPIIIEVLNRIKPPYNVSTLSQLKAVEVLKTKEKVDQQILQIQTQRALLISALNKIEFVKKVYPTDANFILVEFEEAERVFNQLQNKGIIIRNKTAQVKGGLRITVGTPAQNKILLDTLKEMVI